MNPEFRRNLLLELTPYRLVAMPLVLVLLYGAVGLSGDHSAVSASASFVMVGLLTVWGSRLAADAVLGEVAGRTWDSQRMSALGPWSMSWGKLAGSTVFVWYGALLSIPALFYSPATDPFKLAWLILVGLTAQLLALFASLAVQRLRPQRLRFLVTQAQLVGLGGAFLVWGATEAKSLDVNWYGGLFDIEDFIIVSVVVFLGWCGLGIYRLMRAELQFRCWPAGWSAFTLFCGFYVAGFMPTSRITRDILVEGVGGDGEILRLLAAHSVIAVLTWVAAIAEPKGFVRLRRWLDAAKTGSPQRLLPATPAWAPGLLMVLLTTVAILVVFMLPEEDRPQRVSDMLMPERNRAIATFAAALFLFLLRDIGIIHFLNMDGKGRRALLSTLVYFGILYALLPVILASLGLRELLPILVPSPTGPAFTAILPVLLQVGLVAGLIVWRWGKLARAMEESKP
jgi:hypothetical protein